MAELMLLRALDPEQAPEAALLLAQLPRRCASPSPPRLSLPHGSLRRDLTREDDVEMAWDSVVHFALSITESLYILYFAVFERCPHPYQHTNLASPMTHHLVSRILFTFVYKRGFCCLQASSASAAPRPQDDFTT